MDPTLDPPLGSDLAVLQLTSSARIDERVNTMLFTYRGVDNRGLKYYVADNVLSGKAGGEQH